MKITSKQRSYLRSLASKQDAIAQVGKGGVTPQIIESLKAALEKRELIKITVLETSETDAKETGVILAEALHALFVTAIGRKVILYKRSKKEIEHIDLDI